MAGIPLTMGFIAKFYLFAAGVQGALWILLWALVIGSAIGIYYYLRIVFTMTRGESSDAPATASNVPMEPGGDGGGVRGGRDSLRCVSDPTD
ncbi:MAG: hypothetical protein Ct9H300mP8_03510 [Gammaproteobacteria bacterium]|nr:MAG: hypothetical protein Ct9H300mP8_03510 [Gammaproteobacteria bacterium]